MSNQLKKQIYESVKKSGYNSKAIIKNAFKGLAIFFISEIVIFLVNFMISMVGNKNLWDENFWVGFLVTDLVVGIFVNIFELCLSNILWSRKTFKNPTKTPIICRIVIVCAMVYMLICLSVYIIYKICSISMTTISFSWLFLCFIIFGGAFFNSILHAILYR